MHLKNIIVALFFCLITETASAINIVIENNTEYHESTGESIVTAFVEDTISLMPLDVIKNLKPVIPFLMKASDFRATNDYWKRKIATKEQYKERYERILKTRKSGASDSIIIEMLGETVRDTFEIAMSINGPDPLNEGVQKNLFTFMNNGNSLETKISFPGYKENSLDDLVENVFVLKRYKKDNELYSKMVTATAQLWSHVMAANGKQIAQVPQNFIRRQSQIRVLTQNERYALERESYRAAQQRARAEMDEALDKLYDYRVNSFQNNRVVSRPTPTSTGRASTNMYSQPSITTYQPASQPSMSTYQSQPSAEQARKIDDVKSSAQEAITGGKWGK